MSFEVREFDLDAQGDILWNFKLANVSPSQLDFYSQEPSSRSLHHLAQDFITQLDEALEKKHKSKDNKGRVVRKLTEKLLKELRVNL